MKQDTRLWEIDLLRGVAVLGMITYHLAFDLSYFNVADIGLHAALWTMVGRATASVFVFLVGVSLSLSYSRLKLKGGETKKTRRYLLRGLKIFLYGVVITAVTWFFLDEDFVLFGILHLIGSSIILSIPLLDEKPRTLFFAGILLACFFIIPPSFLLTESHWLIWLGFPPQGFSSVDYAPLLPWYGIVLLGLSAGKKLYPGYERRIALPDYSRNKAVLFLCMLGRNSLFIYFIHQPIMLSIMYLLGLGELARLFDILKP